MPLKLVPPRKGKTPFWAVRGTHLGVALDRSTKTSERATAKTCLVKWRADIERGVFAPAQEVTFFDAAIDYMAQTGNSRFVQPLVEYVGKRPLREVNQQLIDRASIALYPRATAATRNRQVHTPASAILKRHGVMTKLLRPKGWRGSKRTDWLMPEQAFRVFVAADGIDPELGLFLRFLCYTGTRLGEALSLTCDRVILAEKSAYLVATKNGDAQLKKVKSKTGPDVHFLTFHTFRHTWATWMRRYAGLDSLGLVATGAWRDVTSA